MTVREMIEALEDLAVTQGCDELSVYRYCDWPVTDLVIDPGDDDDIGLHVSII
jgi:hypothetical protein